MTGDDTPDALAFAHWYEAAQTAQREVARLTEERDEALSHEREMHRSHSEDRFDFARLRADLTALHSQRDEALRDLDAERREKTHRFALRRELEEALGVGDSYADGALDAALARIKALKTVEAERDRLRRELGEALASREREYARAEAAEELTGDLVARWSHESEIVACGRCWRPVPDDMDTCEDCRIDDGIPPPPCTRCGKPSQTSAGDERLCFGCAYDDSTAGGS